MKIMSRVLFFTSWYNEKHEARRAELETCVRNCLESPDLDMVYLLCEGDSRFPIEHPKLVQHAVEERPTYSVFFKYMNQVSHQGDILILSNTDIYPAPGMRPLFQQLQSHQCWALSRWDVTEGGELVHHKRRDSQDNWLFISPIREGINANFLLGKGGCDNAVALWIQEAGYEVSNPSCDVKFCHLHLTGVHNYTPGVDSVPAPYLLIEPTHLGVVQPNKYHIPWQPTASNPLTPHTTQ